MHPGTGTEKGRPGDNSASGSRARRSRPGDSSRFRHQVVATRASPSAKASARKKRRRRLLARSTAFRRSTGAAQDPGRTRATKRQKNESGKQIAKLQGEEKPARRGDDANHGARETLDTELGENENESQQCMLKILNVCADVHNVPRAYTTGDAIVEMQLLTGAPHPTSSSTLAARRGAHRRRAVQTRHGARLCSRTYILREPWLDLRRGASHLRYALSRLNPVGWAGWTTEGSRRPHGGHAYVAVDATDPEGLREPRSSIVGSGEFGKRSVDCSNPPRGIFTEELDATRRRRLPREAGAPAEGHARRGCDPSVLRREMEASARFTAWISFDASPRTSCESPSRSSGLSSYPRVGKSVTIEGETGRSRIVIVLDAGRSGVLPAERGGERERSRSGATAHRRAPGCLRRRFTTR